MDLGRLQIDPNAMVGFEVTVTRTQPSRTLKAIEIPVSGYCIDTPDGKILFDLGCHPQAMGPDGRWHATMQELYPHSGGEECTLPYRLSQLGLGPDDIRFAVLSHLHNDHCGCVEFFKKTQLIVHEDEFTAAFRAFGLRSATTSYVLKDMAEWVKQDLNWRLVARDEGDLELADGVDILNLGAGHSYGMLGLHVRLREIGSVILTSDALYNSTNLGPPTRLPGAIVDIPGYLRTAGRIRKIAAQYQSRVIFGHDPAQFATLRKSTEGPYE
jgi:N-acyl homoserine lactone hydrolase